MPQLGSETPRILWLKGNSQTPSSSSWLLVFILCLRRWDCGTGVLRVCSVAGLSGRLTSMVWAEGLEEPHGHSSRLSLAHRMKALAMALPRVSGHQDSPCCKGLESSGNPGGLKAETCMNSLSFFSVGQGLFLSNSLLCPRIKAWCPTHSRCSINKCGINKGRKKRMKKKKKKD